jgi:glycine/D-amino acid oxidase-like deaminating enzyme
MDLLSNAPFPLLQYGIINSYQSIDRNVNSDVVILGGGITGALISWHLSRAGIPNLLVDKRHPGMGSTSASTALLQYEIDIPLVKLIKLIGEKNAIKSYLLCERALFDLQHVCDQMPRDVNFIWRRSLQYVSKKKEVSLMKEEFRMRRKIGLEVEWVDDSGMRDKFGFEKHGGIYSKNAGNVHAYLFTHSLLEDAMRYGAVVCDRTLITGINYGKKTIELLTANNNRIRCRKLIIAGGYESQEFLPKKVASLHSTYVIISKPFEQKQLWFDNCMIWETNIPYTYISPFADNRIIVGGKDAPYYDPQRRDALLTLKSRALVKAFGELFPNLQFSPDFRWAGTFGETRDGLPYIGSISQMQNCLFALSFGGNGITFSMIAAQLLLDNLKGNKNVNLKLFSFDR